MGKDSEKPSGRDVLGSPGDSVASAPQEGFPPITKMKQPPDPIFASKDYYSRLMEGEGEAAQKVHTNLSSFLKEEDPETKAVFRQRLTSSWWELLRGLTRSYTRSSEKRTALRFGYLLPRLISPSQRKMLATVISQNLYGEPVHYLDEWLDKISAGDVNPLATDETQSSKVKVDKEVKVKNHMQRVQGSKDANLVNLNNLMGQREGLESRLLDYAKSVTSHESDSAFPDIQEPYTASQKELLRSISDIVKNLSQINREIDLHLTKLRESNAQLVKIEGETEDLDSSGSSDSMDRDTVENEVNTLRQLIKLSVGRRGNHTPILMKSFFDESLESLGTRENIMNIISETERLDPGLFQRTYKRTTSRIVPHIIMLPCYGERGVCWEPFELFNRATSRGRLGIPMFARDVRMATIYALADFRWHIAKEKAAHYWMEEGLTGRYYQWFTEEKMRGDIRLQFLEDYILWITKESEGTQKLHREVRALFWRLLPYPQDVKDSLRNRGFVYDELYKKDMNRASSDGY